MKLKTPRKLVGAPSGSTASAGRARRRWARRPLVTQAGFAQRLRAPTRHVLEEAPNSEDEDLLGLGSRVLPPASDFEETPSVRPQMPISTADVEAQIQALEARLDGLIRGAGPASASVNGDAHPLREQLIAPGVDVIDRLTQPPTANLDGISETDSTRQVFNSPYFVKQWGRIALRDRTEEVDDFGLDPRFEGRLRPLFDRLFESYFRVSTPGIDNIPASGAAVVVANHSGTLPLDGAMLRTAFRLRHRAQRDLRWLAEDFVFYLPFAGTFMNRVGAVRACPENAERLLSKNSLIAVFPEGDKGIKKLFRERYRLQRFGRGGFVRLCLRTGSPLIPCAIVGAEETAPMLYRLEYLSELVGLPYVPVTPTFPWLGPLGLIPAPAKWTMYFGDPMELDHYGPEAADDHVLVGRLAEQVRSTIQQMIDRGLSRRKSVWFG